MLSQDPPRRSGSLRTLRLRLRNRRPGLAVIVAVAVVAGISVVGYLIVTRSADTNPAMRPWTYGDFTMRVPVGWTSTTQIPGGSSDVIVFTNGTGDEYLQVEFNRCSGCNGPATISNGLQVGAPGIAEYVPPNAVNVKTTDPWEITYSLTQPFTLYDGSSPAAATSHIYEGLVADDRELAYSLTLQIAVRSSDSSVAQQIFNSVHQSNTPG